MNETCFYLYEKSFLTLPGGENIAYDSKIMNVFNNMFLLNLFIYLFNNLFYR